jgi:hypothetical protein
MAFTIVSAGLVSGAVTLDLISDGSGVDGFGQSDLGETQVQVTAAVDNYAQAGFENLSGLGVFSGSPTSGYTLDLGTITQGSGPLTIRLGVLNSATGLADILQGSLAVAGSSAFSVTGLGDFSGLGAGQADTSPTITLDTSTAGVFTETLTLHSEGTNASGYSGALADETLTITGTVQHFAAAPASWSRARPASNPSPTRLASRPPMSSIRATSTATPSPASLRTPLTPRPMMCWNSSATAPAPP